MDAETGSTATATAATPLLSGPAAATVRPACPVRMAARTTRRWRRITAATIFHVLLNAKTARNAMKFGIGQPVRRHEDLRLITGHGRYTDDVTLPRSAHAFVLRSPAAHARLKRIDASAARRMPGVLLVATGADIAAEGLGNLACQTPLNNRDGTPRHDTPRPLLALDRVRYVGQPVAFVVAE